MSVGGCVWGGVLWGVVVLFGYWRGVVGKCGFVGELGGGGGDL